MNNHDRFDIIVRTTGLVLLLLALFRLVNWIMWYNDWYSISGAGQYAIYGLVEGVIGFVLLRGAAPVADWAYPMRDEDGDVDDSPGEDVAGESHHSAS